MREGLRSCSSMGGDIAVGGEDEDDRKAGEGLDLNVSVADMAGDELTLKEECDEVVGESKVADDDGMKIESVGGDGGKKRKRMRKGSLGVDVGVPVRVLRSRVVMGRGKGEGGFSADVELRGSYGSEGETVRGVEGNGGRMSGDDEIHKVGESLGVIDKLASGEISMRKRGRPPKLPVSNGTKKRRGRPPKKQSTDDDALVGEEIRKVDVENMGEGEIESAEAGNVGEGNNLKRNRGRLAKSQIGNDVAEQVDNDDSTGECRKNVDGDYIGKEYKSAVVEESHVGVASNRRRGRRSTLQRCDEVSEKGNEGILVGEEGKDLASDNLSKVDIERAEVEKLTRGSNESENGRPEKGLNECDEPASPLKCKVGRRPKQVPGSLDKNTVEDEKTVGSGKRQHGSRLRQSVNKASDKRFKGTKGSKISKNKEMEKNTGGDGGSDNKKMVKNTLGDVGSINKKMGKNIEGDGTRARSKAKQVVREKIVAMLLKAGWSVEYRPRSNKEYNDAVYVNPAGKTHWSVTLAYKVLKQECEDSNGPLKGAEKDFVFTPLPEEELGMLARITVKQREDKGKKKKDTGGEGKADEVTKKKKLKDKSSVRKQDNGADRRKRFSLLVRRSNKDIKADDDGYIPYLGKRTLLAWLIDSGTVPEKGRVKFMNQEQNVMREGIITRDGIKCDCCNEVLTLSDFEKHAGSQLSQPYQNLYLESGASLLECQLDSWRKEEEFKSKWFHLVDVNCEDPNDDTCNLCGDGGDLICCDGCPSTYHQNCLAIENFPSGDWLCFRCTCKFCKEFGGNTNQQDSSDNTTAASALKICRLCEEKYHEECVEETSAVKDDTTLSTFCGKACQEIFKRLRPLLGVKQELEEGFSWRLTQRTDVNSDISHSEAQKNLESNSKLAIALSVMNECFLPLVDHKSGANLMRNILYSCGSNFSRLDYTGFYTAILEKDDEVIAVACIRIHGSHLAEMPFIGVRDLYRRQGMCRRLLGAIETGLGSLNVEKLVIPAVTELIETWTSIFGFKALEPSSRLKLRNMNILVFPGTDMLQKPLLNNQPAERHIYAEGLASIKFAHQMKNEAIKLSDMGHLNGSGNKTCHVTENELTALNSNLQLLNGSSDHCSFVSESVDLQESFTGKVEPVVVTSAVDEINKCSESNVFEKQGGSDDKNKCLESNVFEEQGGSDDNNLISFKEGLVESRSQMASTLPVSRDSAEDVRGALHNVFTDCSSQFLAADCHQTGQNCGIERECASKTAASDLCMSSAGLEASNVTQIDSCCHDQDIIADECGKSTGSLQPPEFNSQAEQTAMQCPSESISDTKTVPGIAALCASAGGNACGSEAVILSNRAS